MNRSTTDALPPVSPEERQHLLAEYRRLGLENQAEAHMVYHGPHQACPWPGCGYRIAAIGFQLDAQGDQRFLARWLKAWWQGAGLVGACPGCGRLVLFGMAAKTTVMDPAGLEGSVLPDNWYQMAYLVPSR
jgi:hypothetical protein